MVAGCISAVQRRAPLKPDRGGGISWVLRCLSGRGVFPGSPFAPRRFQGGWKNLQNSGLVISRPADSKEGGKTFKTAGSYGEPGKTPRPRVPKKFASGGAEVSQSCLWSAQPPEKCSGRVLRSGRPRRGGRAARSSRTGKFKFENGHSCNWKRPYASSEKE